MANLPDNFKDIELIILDMDGVLTSEEAYWDVAGLVVRELIESPAYLALSPPDYTPVADLFYRKMANGTRMDCRKYLPSELIKKCKTRGINSNWDLAYIVAGLYLAPLFSPVIETFQHQTEFEALLSSSSREDRDEPMIACDETPAENSLDRQLALMKDCLSPVWPALCQSVAANQWSVFLQAKDLYLWGDYFRKQKFTLSPFKNIELLIIDDFHPDIRGLRLLDELNRLLKKPTVSPRPVFGRNTPLWHECRDIFQSWYLGEGLYEETYQKSLIFKPKPGVIHRESPLHSMNDSHACLQNLKDAGYTLGIATGRPRMEIITPLQRWDMLKYFEPERIVTYDEVEKTEKIIHKNSVEINLGKPHPFPFLQAIYPQKSGEEIVEMSETPIEHPHKVLVIGDAQADIWAAQKIGCRSAALLSGAIGPANRKQLDETKPDVVFDSILHLSDALCSIKKG
jgi:phosphoglycolate phosphatase-like HAD superfamily hydrolase